MASGLWPAGHSLDAILETLIGYDQLSHRQMYGVITYGAALRWRYYSGEPRNNAGLSLLARQRAGAHDQLVSPCCEKMSQYRFLYTSRASLSVLRVATSRGTCIVMAVRTTLT